MNEFDHFRNTYVADINEAISFSGQSVDFFARTKADVLVPLFDAKLPQGPLDVLDMGCGHGLVHPHLHRRRTDLTLTGVDVASEVVSEARNLNPNVTYDSYDGRRLPYETDRFDVAFTICVLHHVLPADRDAFMAEMRRVVRPGGLVVAIEHNPLNPLTQYIVRTCPIDENAVLLWPRELRDRLRTAGLNSIGLRYMVFTPFSAPIFRDLDRRLGWLPAGAQYCAWGYVPIGD